MFIDSQSKFMLYKGVIYMPSFLSSLFKKGSKKKADVCVFGPSQAGKTTFIRYLETGQTQDDPPLSTMGIEIRENGLTIDDWRFSLIDVGGQKMYQDVFWEMAVEQGNARRMA